jgi:signal peptidase I
VKVKWSSNNDKTEMGNAERPLTRPLRAHHQPRRKLTAMRTRHARKILSTALGLLVLGSLWFYFAPVQLGGSATYVVTHGISMEPRFHTGDLAIVRSQSSYHVGEIVAYENKMLHTIVLHRIIGRDGSRYIFKGDNNNFVDFEHPAASQLVGALWLHIPGAGTTLKSIRSPLLVGVLVAAGMLLFTGTALTRRRRRRHRDRRAGHGSEQSPLRHSPSLSSEPAITAVAIGLVALLPFVMLALLSFTRPTSKLHTVPVPYKQSGTFSYTANATPGPAYSSGQAVTGDPLFTRVLSDVDVNFNYVFTSSTKHTLAGAASLSGTLSSTSGWSTTFPLGSATHFHGTHASVSAKIDLTALQALIRNVENTTRVGGTYTLTVTPHIDATGTLDQLPLSTSFAPPLQFSLNELEANPITGGSGGTTASGKAPSSVFAPSTSGSVSARRYAPLYVSIKIARLSVATARVIALIGIAAVIGVLLAIVALMKTRPRPQDEARSIHGRYGHMIIPVAHVALTPGASVIDVADMESLVRIAEHYDRSILHETAGSGEAFWVSDESGQFRYAVGGPPPARAVEIPEQPRPFSSLTSDVYADELELGGVIAAFEAPPTPEPAGTAPAVQDGWAAYDLADAITQESRPGWRSESDAVDASTAPTGSFVHLTRR